MKKSVLLSIALMFTVVISSAQSGITWGMGMNIASNSHGNHHPRMSLDAAGNPLVLWGRMSDESAMFSRWTGSSFTAPVKLNPAGITVATAGFMGPDIASNGNTVYVVFKQTPETSDSSHVYIMSSFNGGVSFLPPVRVDFTGDSLSRFPTVTTDATGNPIVGFMKFNSTFGDARWVVTKSSDYGNTFSPDVKASGWSGAGALVCDCCSGSILSSGNVTTMLYRDNLSNIRDIWAGISTDNSATYNSGFNIDNNNWMIMTCPSSGPDGVIIGDSLYTVFLNGGSGSYRIYQSTSSISNATVNSVNMLTGNIPGLTQQNFPCMASDGTAMAMVWKQTVYGASQLPILFTNNIASGFPMAYDTVDLDDITNADVALANGNIFVVWEDDNSGTVKYRKGTYSSVTSLNEVQESTIAVFPNPSNDFLNITSNGNKMFSVSIFNSLGQNIYTEESDKDLKLNIGDYASGLYFIQIKFNDKFITQKFIRE